MKNSVLLIVMSLILLACGSDNDETPTAKQGGNQEPSPLICQNSIGINWPALLSESIADQCNKLSDYKLFNRSESSILTANVGGFEYQLNSQLFTDYARKYRYVFLPDDKKVEYSETEVLNFPVGTVFAKIFSLPLDTDKAEEKIIEIRLMIHRASGWVGLPFVWNEADKEAYLDLDGESINFSLVHKGVAYSDNYSVPSYGSCRTCHQFNNEMSLIGPKSRHLNKGVVVDGELVNQLQYWQSEGILAGMPSALEELEYAPDWRIESEALELRAKAYLDINCAHCHREEGAASLSGLKLEFGRQSVDYHHGVCNSAHGWRGGGFDIWPGDSANSSIPLRMTLSAAPDRMPPLGRSLVDNEAVELIKQWIDSMPYQECAQ